MAQKKQTNFESLENLQLVVNVVNEAFAALDDQNRTIEQSPISKVLAVTNGAGADSDASFAEIYRLGTVKPSAAEASSEPATYKFAATPKLAAFQKKVQQATNMFVLSVPGVTTLGKAATVAYERKQLQQEKVRLLIAAIEKYYGIAAASKEESDASPQRTAYLGSISILLQKAIKELKADLGIEGV